MSAATDVDAGFPRLADARTVLPAGADQKLADYLELLAKWNRTYSLTAIRDPQQMRTHHVHDALAVLPHLPAKSELRVLDVGSGSGSPGLPLAIARPSWRVVLIDSSRKKGAFLRQAVIELSLSNVEVVTARVEDYQPMAPFDVVIARAFADLSAFAALAMRHVAHGGRLVAMKGAYPSAEIAALPPTVRVVATPTLDVPGLDARRHLVVMAPRVGEAARA